MSARHGLAVWREIQTFSLKNSSSAKHKKAVVKQCVNIVETLLVNHGRKVGNAKPI
jgi:hypothetical protein